jgi:hypothetical protein
MKKLNKIVPQPHDLTFTMPPNPLQGAQNDMVNNPDFGNDAFGMHQQYDSSTNPFNPFNDNSGKW